MKRCLLGFSAGHVRAIFQLIRMQFLVGHLKTHAVLLLKLHLKGGNEQIYFTCINPTTYLSSIHYRKQEQLAVRNAGCARSRYTLKLSLFVNQSMNESIN